MFKSLKFFSVFFVFLFLSGCASSCGSADNTNTNGNIGEVIVPKMASNVKQPVNSTNTGMVNAVANKENPTLDNSKVKKIDLSKVETKMPTIKAPDNSEVYSRSVGKAFVETRQFKNHPQLDKVDRIRDGGTDFSYKVYLKNGKTYDLEKGDLKRFRQMPASDILKAVGVTPAKVENKDGDQSDEKIKEKLSKKPNS